VHVEGSSVEPLPVLEAQTWREFADSAGESVPCLVEGLWPEGSLGFIAAPPKKGKTWVGLGLGLSLASGRSFLEFEVARPRTVLYVALEGHRAALRDRIGALARGLGLDPDSETDLARFHIAYKPRGINLAEPAWAQSLHQRALAIGAELVVVDVLRGAAVMDENSAKDFAALRANLSPLLDEGISLAFLHHFGKLTELSRDRDAGERMSGSGAMYGALDVGIFITGSERGAFSSASPGATSRMK